MSDTTWIGSSDEGNHGTPGSQATMRFAGVRLVSGGFELVVKSARGSNQGYMQWDHSVQRKYRHSDLDDLLPIGISEVKLDDELDGTSDLCAAIRNAIFEAKDSLSDLDSDDGEAGGLIEALDDRREGLCIELLDAMNDRRITELDAGGHQIRISYMSLNSGRTVRVLTVDGSGDLESRIGSGFFYAGGDLNCQIQRPSPQDVLNLIESWPAICQAFREFDKSIKDAVKAETQTIDGGVAP